MNFPPSQDLLRTKYLLYWEVATGNMFCSYWSLNVIIRNTLETDDAQREYFKVLLLDFCHLLKMMTKHTH